jgi:hypothetical protein
LPVDLAPKPRRPAFSLCVIRKGGAEAFETLLPGNNLRLAYCKLLAIPRFVRPENAIRLVHWRTVSACRARHTSHQYRWRLE